MSSTLGNATLNLTGTIGATAFQSSTGSGNTVVLQTSPSLTTPNLGTPSAAVMTNATGTAKSLVIVANVTDLYHSYGGI